MVVAYSTYPVQSAFSAHVVVQPMDWMCLIGCARTLTILHSSLNSKHEPASKLSECMFSVSRGMPASWLSILFRWYTTYPSGRWGHALFSAAFVTSFYFFPACGSTHFVSSYSSCSVGYRFTVGQASPKEVCLQLKDVEMGPSWVWWIHADFTWLSCPQWYTILQRHLSFLLISLSYSSLTTSQSKARPQKKKKKNAQAIISFNANTKFFQENNSREDIATPDNLSISSLAEICLLLMALQEFRVCSMDLYWKLFFFS